MAHTLLVDARGAAIAGFFITVSCGIVFLCVSAERPRPPQQSRGLAQGSSHHRCRPRCRLTLRVTDGTFSALARQSLVDEVRGRSMPGPATHARILPLLFLDG